MGVDALVVLVPGVSVAAGLLLRSRLGSSNLWDVLHELARGRVRAGLERERRLTLLMLLPSLLGVSTEQARKGSRCDAGQLEDEGDTKSRSDQDSCS